ncbi:MAG TPA: 50S ribosomal protein L4 [Candidatus Bathyarchaeia archaeon]|nr:50S ribosomal protein L4 [Candidatus Bathyarchaeia archaeon]
MSTSQPRTVPILDLEGKSAGEISLPTVFGSALRLDVIKKATLAQESRRFQPQGRNLMAGKRTTAEGFGVGRGISRVPRIGGHGPLSGTAAFAPGTVSGRMAFPPVTAKKTVKLINRKERRIALGSAIAATASDQIVRKRGHKFEGEKQLPLVVTDELEKMSKSSEAKRFLNSVGVWEDIVRVRKSKKVTGGSRSHAVGPLVVVGDDKSARRALRNFEGLSIVRADQLSVEALAPGTRPGRLTIWTESALKTIAGRKW